MSYILNIDTATDICSIAVSQAGKILSLVEEANNNHASRITLMIEEALVEAKISIKDLAAVAMSNGPGSYTSLRVGTSTAKGICYALDIPLIAVDTLTSLAYAAFREIEVTDFLYCPMIDARRMEVYMILFGKNDKNMELSDIPNPFGIEGPSLEIIEPLNNVIIDESAFKNYFDQGKKVVLTGNGAAKCKTVINSVNIVHVDKLCSAAYLIPFSTEAFLKKEFVDVAYHTPQYLKSPNITTPKLRT
jgi:tRNA threonylcarbamoyladenosine biosynthesis protein TsaB